MLTILEQLKQQRALHIAFYDEQIEILEYRLAAARHTPVITMAPEAPVIEHDPEREMGMGGAA